MEDIVVTVLDTNYIPDYKTREEERINNETARVNAETVRISNENVRIQNETQRQLNETNRITQYNLVQAKLDNGDFNGEDGADGVDGKDGEDGYSPTVTTSKSGRTTTITITDKNGEHVATVLDGEDGSASSGDMKKSVYDTNDSGVVDNAEKVNNHTVGCDVPADAVFTDTVFSGNYNDLTNKPVIPSKTSDITNDSGYITGYTETDPTVPSHVKNISQSDITSWNNKSTFSGNYNDLANKPTIPDELSDLTDDSTHRLVSDTEKTTWNNKSSFSGSYNDLTNKPTIPTVPTNVSAFTNDAGYLTSHQDISGKQDIIQYSTMPTANAGNLGKIVQYIGTTDSTYTNGYFYKCVSDGASTPTYSWENIEVQAGGGGGSSYTAGTNIEITSDNVINNKIPYKINPNGSVSLGKNAVVNNGSYSCLSIGTSAGDWHNLTAATSIGFNSQASNNDSIAIGASSRTQKTNQCMIGNPYSGVGKINELAIGTTSGIKVMATEEFVTNYLTTVTGYDNTKTQVLKNVNGTLTWVDEV